MSGVTIATGFDLGQRNLAELKALNLDEKLILKLKPYLGFKNYEALELLKEHPLKLDLIDAHLIDRNYKTKFINDLKIKYDMSNPYKKKFLELPKEAQTVIASVAFQYGVNLNVSTPKFWNSALRQNWTIVIKELNSFGDKYPTRRRKEALYLKRLVNEN